MDSSVPLKLEALALHPFSHKKPMRRCPAHHSLQQKSYGEPSEVITWPFCGDHCERARPPKGGNIRSRSAETTAYAQGPRRGQISDTMSAETTEYSQDPEGVKYQKPKVERSETWGESSSKFHDLGEVEPSHYRNRTSKPSATKGRRVAALHH